MNGSPVLDLLQSLRRLQVRLSVADGQLRLQAPRGVLTYELKREVARRKPEILQFLESPRPPNEPLRNPITPQPRPGFLPLSFAQERLWFLDQVNSGSPAYNIPFALKLKGPLDSEALEKSLKEILRRHEILRTSIQAKEGIPEQVVRDGENFKLTFFDLAGMEDREKEAALRERLTQAQGEPFDLENDLLIRCHLIRLSASEHVFSVTMHHIAGDGWSWEVFVRELGILHEAFRRDESSPLNDLPIQYADYAIWQRQFVTEESLKDDLDCWKRILGEEVPVLDLPTRQPREGVRYGFGESEHFRFSQSFLESLKQFAREEEVTLYMLLLAAFGLLMQRYCGQNQALIGCPAANRNHQEIEGLIGCFANTLLLPCDGRGDPEFKKYLSRIREAALEAFEHQEIPFEKLVNALQPERRLDRNPLFQVMLAQQSPEKVPEFSGLGVEYMEVPCTSSAFDLTLSFQECDHGLKGSLEYDTALFEPELIRQMIGHWQRLLLEAIHSPSKRLSRFDPLSREEKARLVGFGTGRTIEGPAESPVSELFERQAERTPNAPAVEMGADSLSFAELNERANRLAHYLRRLGVGPEIIVGVGLERSPEAIVALLAVLKAGGAFLPLNLEYPRERLARVLADSGAKVLITRSSLVGNGEKNDSTQFATKSLEGVNIVRIDEEWDEIEKYPVSNPEPLAGPGHPAYVIYTSGSTGKPKGVLVGRREMTAHHLAVRELFELNSSDRVLQFAALNFDVSIEEIFPTLLSGATLVLRTEPMLNTYGAFLKEVRQRSLTVLNLPTAFWQGMVQEASQSDLAFPEGVRLMIVGGEKVPTAAYQQWRDWMGTKIRWLNGYGPTETTISAAFFDPDDAQAGWEVWPEAPIGRPVSGARLYLLDERRNPVPPGVIGEIYIGGDMVARGYLNQPEQTENCFLPDPFDEKSGARLYRTGDLGRWLPDGNLQFFGRNDQQLKIRGFRVEPGEIEAAMREHPSVRQALVVDYESAGNTRDLAVYFTENAGAVDPKPEEFIAHLQSRLPSYMIPSVFIPLKQFPMTASGKIDRRALPSPRDEAKARASAFQPPRTHLEKTLADIWSEILGLERIGIHDNFFNLGGHSLLAAKMMARIRRTLIADAPLSLVFESPTIESLAEAIGRLQTENRPEPPMLRPCDRSLQIPPSFAQERMWFLHRLDPESTAYHIPLAWRLRGPLSFEALEKSLNAIVDRHEPLRTVFQHKEGKLALVIRASQPCRLRVRNLEDLPEAERERQVEWLTREFTDAPFDLSQGPLIRWKLLKLGPEDHVLLINMHHIIADEWSIAVFQRELAGHYNGYGPDAEFFPEALPVQYADFGVWQRKCLTRGCLNYQLDYWKKRFSGDLPVLDLATDRSRPRTQTFNGGALSRRLPADLRDRLNAFCRDRNMTPFMLGMAAFAVLLKAHSGQSNLIIGTPIANRNHADMEALIGLFLNTLALRLDLSGDPPVHKFLNQVKSRTVEAFTHQDLPFEKLVEELHLQRELSHHPLFQVMFVLEDSSAEKLNLRELDVESLTIENQTSKFDLTLFVREEPEGLSVTLEYNSDLFDRKTIEPLMSHYQGLLEALPEATEKRLSELPILTGEERGQLIVEWNRTDAPFPSDQCFHHLFEAQVEKTPDATAVACGEQSLTYRHLNQRANRLAHYLKSRGVASDTIVGLCVDRSVDLMVALLGILKAGGCYLPLDPAAPAERLRTILEDSRARILLVSERLKPVLKDWADAVIAIDADWPVIELESAHNPESPVTPGNLAYLIYTSGSTGLPKGVMIEHRGLTNYLWWAARFYQAEQGTGSVVHSSIGFDLTVTGLFVPLLAGKKVTLTTDSEGGIRHLTQVLKNSSGLSLLKLTPAHLEILSHELTPEEAAGLTRRIIVGGDNLLGEHLRWWRQHAPETILINEYGPTETVVGCCVHEVRKDEEFFSSVPIGKPIANTRMYILDERLNPVPIGVPGELFIAGPGVARGYLNRPLLTQQSFIENPFGEKENSRIYRTGDLGRWRADGTIEFLGRRDEQLKIRGYRVELEEIEAALCRHPSVQDAVVVYREYRSGTRRLEAFVTTRDEEELVSVDDLRDFCTRQLPEYMIPAAILAMNDLPLTRNGKVDRKALPPLAEEERRGEEQYAPPKKELEKRLAAMWGDLLPKRKIGVTDNFFKIGGHSLLAVQLLAMMNKFLGRELPLAFVFERPTIREMVEAIEQQSFETSLRAIVPLTTSGDSPPLFCFHGIESHAWFYQELVRDLTGEVPVFGVQGRGLAGDLIPSMTMQEMVRQYVDEILALYPNGPVHLAGFCAGALLAYEAARQLKRRGASIGRLFLLDADLGEATLKRLRRHKTEFTAHPLAFAKKAWKTVFQKIHFRRNRYYRLVYKTNLLLGRKIPLKAHRFYVKDFYKKVIARYKVLPYEGDAILVRSEKNVISDPYMGWGAYIRGNIKLVKVPGGHDDVWQSSHVGKVLKQEIRNGSVKGV